MTFNMPSLLPQSILMLIYQTWSLPRHTTLPMFPGPWGAISGVKPSSAHCKGGNKKKKTYTLHNLLLIFSAKQVDSKHQSCRRGYWCAQRMMRRRRRTIHEVGGQRLTWNCTSWEKSCLKSLTGNMLPLTTAVKLSTSKTPHSLLSVFVQFTMIIFREISFFVRHRTPR